MPGESTMADRMTTRLPLPVLPEDVRRYLQWSNWRLVGEGSRGAVFEGGADDSGQTIVLKVPGPEEPHSESEIERIVAALSVIERRPEDIVVRAIQGIDRDFLFTAVVGDSAAVRGISLLCAPEVVTALRDLMTYSAAGEDKPRPYFAKATSAGRKHAARCLFGHTFRGSFGFTVESPLPVGTGPLFSAEEVDRPFARRVMERIGRGIVAVTSAARTERIDELVAGYQTGLNANMCEAILQIADVVHQSELRVSMSWSPEWPALAELVDFQPTTLDSRSYRCLESVASELRPHEEEESTTLCGRVVLLRSEEAPSEDDLGEHEVVIVSSSQLRVYAALNAADYRSACEAHVNGCDVCVDGQLVHRGKHWHLISPANFSIRGSVGPQMTP